ncbi:hypothetical protein O1M63_52135 [Streptomyces mirabilis]|nr:hypothetical protein [Streptomyces mirabilis]
MARVLGRPSGTSTAVPDVERTAGVASTAVSGIERTAAVGSSAASASSRRNSSPSSTEVTASRMSRLWSSRIRPASGVMVIIRSRSEYPVPAGRTSRWARRPAAERT